MERRLNGRLVASVSLFLATLILLIVIVAIDYGVGIRASIGNGPYDDFVATMRFGLGGLYGIFGSIIFYGGIVLFIVSFIYFYIKKTLRYIFLPIIGISAFEIGAYMLQCVSYRGVAGLPSWYGGFAIFAVAASLSFGIAAFTLSFVFPRLLIKKANDPD